MTVYNEDTAETLGALSGILLHPDTGKVEGFFVRMSGFLVSQTLFLSSMDIIRWGTKVYVRHADALSDLGDLVRLQSLVEEQRPVLGQSIRTESGRTLGRCADVQFDTHSFVIEWIFPKSLWRWGTALPVSQILEVRKDGIVVKDPALPVTQSALKKVEMPVLEMPEAA